MALGDVLDKALARIADADKDARIAELLDKVAAANTLAADRGERIAELTAVVQRVWDQIEAAEFENIDDDSDCVLITVSAQQAREIRAALAAVGEKK